MGQRQSELGSASGLLTLSTKLASPLPAHLIFSVRNRRLNSRNDFNLLHACRSVWLRSSRTGHSTGSSQADGLLHEESGSRVTETFTNVLNRSLCTSGESLLSTAALKNSA